MFKRCLYLWYLQNQWCSMTLLLIFVMHWHVSLLKCKWMRRTVSLISYCYINSSYGEYLSNPILFDYNRQGKKITFYRKQMSACPKMFCYSIERNLIFQWLPTIFYFHFHVIPLIWPNVELFFIKHKSRHFHQGWVFFN